MKVCLKCITIVVVLVLNSGVAMADARSPKIEDVSSILKYKIFFGHQSVGFNIVDGINDISDSFYIVESITVPERSNFFMHSLIGTNGNPMGKVEAFSEIIEMNDGDFDVAFMKFCYADISADSDVEAIFNFYRTKINELEVLYPEITFIHCTVPLTTIQKGPKAFIKRILGQPLWGQRENIQRQKYNELLRNEYKDDEVVFDIARIESTDPSGEFIKHTDGDYTYYSIFPGYTYDSGHLNKEGRVLVAGELLKILSKLNINSLN